MKLVALASLVLSASATTSPRDVSRALMKGPRKELRGRNFQDIAQTLNGAMAHLNTEPCENFSIEQLNDLKSTLFAARSEALNELYPDDDSRRILSDLGAHQEAWETDLIHSLESDDMHAKVRDGKCAEAVMWFIHHLGEDSREEILQLSALPRLPEVAHPAPERGAPGHHHDQHRRYLQQTGCAGGHALWNSKDYENYEWGEGKEHHWPSWPAEWSFEAKWQGGFHVSNGGFMTGADLSSSADSIKVTGHYNAHLGVQTLKHELCDFSDYGVREKKECTHWFTPNGQTYTTFTGDDEFCCETFRNCQAPMPDFVEYMEDVGEVPYSPRPFQTSGGVSDNGFDYNGTAHKWEMPNRGGTYRFRWFSKPNMEPISFHESFGQNDAIMEMVNFAVEPQPASLFELPPQCANAFNCRDRADNCPTQA
jgi:hypothetical protein